MVLTLTSSDPTAGEISVPLSAQVSFILESTASVDTNTLNVKIRGISAITDGVAQPGFTASISTTSIPGGEQLDVDIIQALSFNSFEEVQVDIQVNDTDSQFSGGFSFTTEDVVAPVFADLTPAPNSKENSTNTPIFFRIQDQGSGIELSSICASLIVTTESGSTALDAILNGNLQPGFDDPEKNFIQVVGNSVDVFLTSDTEFPSGSEVEVSLAADDQDNTTTKSYKFEIVDLEAPLITNLIPQNGATNVDENTTITVVFSDPNGVGVEQDSINIKVNGIGAVEDGNPQYAFAAVNFIQSGSSIIVVIDPINPLPSAQDTKVDVSVEDKKGNSSDLTYSFTIRDFKAPRFVNITPADGYSDVLPETNICFTICEDPDGYGVDFQSLEILVDGYSVVDGYFDGYGVYTKETERDGYGNLLFRGYTTTIKELTQSNKYDVIVDPHLSFDFNKNVFVQLEVSDKGGHSASTDYSFTIAAEDTLVTRAIPDTGTYQNYLDGYGLVDGSKFLFDNGIVFETNIPNTTTYYTLDGTLPSVDKFGRVRGNTKVYTGKPILLQREGLHVLKFFSTDSAGNEEKTRQEVYMIKPFPPEAREIKSVSIVQDIPFPTTIIPVENTALLEAGQVIQILDDIRPPVLTNILSVNETSNPPFLIVDDSVERLTVKRNARVNIIPETVDPATTIEFNTRSIPEFLYIGSNGKQEEQADSVIEQLRILNRASTDDEILADFALLDKGSRFFNQEDQVILSSDFNSLELDRSNLPDNTLVLLNFDGNVLNVTRRGALENNTVPIVDKKSAANTVIFRVQVKSGEFVDRELLRKVLRNFAPVDIEIQVEFEEVD